MKNSLVVLVLSLVLVNAYIEVGPKVDNKVGPEGEVIAQVVGGRPATAEEAPWQISLNAWSGSKYSHICGGSIIGERTVLTAAHCCDGSSALELKVKFGGSDRTKLEKSIQVIYLQIHPHYDRNTINNDVCVLTLCETISPATNIQIISIAKNSPTTGTPAQLTGWGLTKGNDSKLPIVNQCVNMDILSQPECNKKWADLYPVTPSMICAESKTASGCNGDSGGPLTVFGKLVGVVSWGANGCPMDTTVRPTVFADPASAWLRPWILKALKNGEKIGETSSKKFICFMTKYFL